MKIYLKLFFIISALTLSVILKFNYSEVFINTLYTVSGIMFSIGLGLVVTFNLHGAKNRRFIISIRRNLKTLRSLYIGYFIISTFFYLVESQLRDKNDNVIHIIKNSKIIKLDFDFSTFTICMLLYSTMLYIINMIDLQKLSESIFDETNK